MLDIYSQRRSAMVSGQLRPNGILDGELADAYGRCERQEFLPEELRDLAYFDEDIPLSSGKRALIEPLTEAWILQVADIGADDVVLVVGAYPGTMAYLASELASAVLALEQGSNHALQLRETFAKLGTTNLFIEERPLNDEKNRFKPRNPCDRILFSAAVGEVPRYYFDYLAEGGKLVAVIRKNEENAGILTVFTKSAGIVARSEVREAYIPWLAEFAPVRTFEF